MINQRDYRINPQTWFVGIYQLHEDNFVKNPDDPTQTFPY